MDMNLIKWMAPRCICIDDKATRPSNGPWSSLSAGDEMEKGRGGSGDEQPSGKNHKRLFVGPNNWRTPSTELTSRDRKGNWNWKKVV